MGIYALHVYNPVSNKVEAKVNADVLDISAQSRWGLPQVRGVRQSRSEVGPESWPEGGAPCCYYVLVDSVLR